MTGRSTTGVRRTLGVTSAVAVAAGYASWVASTMPFTGGANLAVAVGFAIVGVVAARALVNRRRALDEEPRIGAPEAPQRTVTAWIVVVGALVVLELVGYVVGSGNRVAYPTASSLYDAASAGSGVAKAAVVFVWMALGWGLFGR